MTDQREYPASQMACERRGLRDFNELRKLLVCAALPSQRQLFWNDLGQLPTAAYRDIPVEEDCVGALAVKVGVRNPHELVMPLLLQEQQVAQVGLAESVYYTPDIRASKCR